MLWQQNVRPHGDRALNVGNKHVCWVCARCCGQVSHTYTSDGYSLSREVVGLVARCADRQSGDTEQTMHGVMGAP